jgi:hypothetical protein
MAEAFVTVSVFTTDRSGFSTESLNISGAFNMAEKAEEEAIGSGFSKLFDVCVDVTVEVFVDIVIFPVG